MLPRTRYHMLLTRCVYIVCGWECYEILLNNRISLKVFVMKKFCFRLIVVEEMLLVVFTIKTRKLISQCNVHSSKVNELSKLSHVQNYGTKTWFLKCSSLIEKEFILETRNQTNNRLKSE